MLHAALLKHILKVQNLLELAKEEQVEPTFKGILAWRFRHFFFLGLKADSYHWYPHSLLGSNLNNLLLLLVSTNRFWFLYPGGGCCVRTCSFHSYGHCSCHMQAKPEEMFRALMLTFFMSTVIIPCLIAPECQQILLCHNVAVMSLTPGTAFLDQS